ncbi:MAG: flagellar motor switch protein FliM [Burkholderiaceae bacterium]
MSEAQLSQDEIDTLLDGVATDAPAATPWPARDGSSVAPVANGIGAVAGSFDVATAERFGNGHLPTLSLINERFVELFDTALYSFTGRRAVIAADAAVVTKYASFVGALSIPSSLNIVRMGPSCGNALFVFDASLLYFVIDSLFGGNGTMTASKAGRNFTTTEQRLIGRLCDIVFANYAKAWESVHPMQFELLRSESEVRFVNLAAPDDAVLAFGFTITSGTSTGQFQVCMPLAGIDPIRDVITREVREKTTMADTRWSERLAAQVSAAEVELVATLASVPLTCKELLEMKIGDVIVLDIKPTIVASADGIPVLRCRYGNADGRYAIRVEEVMAPSSNA